MPAGIGYLGRTRAAARASRLSGDLGAWLRGRGPGIPNRVNTSRVLSGNPNAFTLGRPMGATGAGRGSLRQNRMTLGAPIGGTGRAMGGALSRPGAMPAGMRPAHQNWFMRHKVLTGLGIGAALAYNRHAPGPPQGGRPTGQYMY